MKRIYIIIITLIILPLFSFHARAQDTYTAELFGFFDTGTKGLLEEAGIAFSDGETVWDITPARALDTVKNLFTNGLSAYLSEGAVCIILVIVSGLVSAFVPDNKGLFNMAKSIALMSVMYLSLTFSGEIFTQCCSALLMTKDFMLVLIPIFTGIVSFSGNPALALSFNSVVFSFAEAVSVAFSDIVPSVGALVMCICCAGAVNPFMKLEAFSKIIMKAASFLMAFVAGIFVAVLSIRGVISGAADSVTIRGLRFIIGNSVPVVGSAIGEALNSIAAGLGLIKNTVGVVGIVGVIAINLPVLVNVFVWKGILYVISVTAELSGSSEIKSFSADLSGVLSLIAGAVCFTGFVFIISIAIIITISRS